MAIGVITREQLTYCR